MPKYKYKFKYKYKYTYKYKDHALLVQEVETLEHLERVGASTRVSRRRSKRNTYT